MSAVPPGPGRLHGRTAVVTGAARGIGAVLALRLAREGACIAAVGLEPENLSATKTRCAAHAPARAWTGPLDPAVGRIAAGIARRAPRVYAPPWVRAVQLLPRGAVPAAVTGSGAREVARVAAELRATAAARRRPLGPGGPGPEPAARAPGLPAPGPVGEGPGPAGSRWGKKSQATCG